MTTKKRIAKTTATKTKKPSSPTRKTTDDKKPSTAKISATVSSQSDKGRRGDLAPERIATILKALDEAYPNAVCALHHKSAWELLVATILSAQCTDVRVNMVTPVLFRKYPTVQDFAALVPEQLQPDVRSTGFFRNKS